MVDNTTVPISLTDMVLCFRLPVVGSRIVLEGNDDSIRELRDLYEVKGGYIYKGTLEKMLNAGDSEKQLREVKRLLKRLPKDVAENSVKEIVPCHVSTNVDEKTLGDEHSLLVSSEGLPNLAFGVRDEHLHHNDMTELLSKALEQISDLQRIVGEQAAWRVEVEKELTRRELHDTQMSFVIEDLRQKIATQDTIIETLREQLAKKENSTQNEFNKRSLQDSIYVSESAVHPLISDSKEMNKLGSTVAKRVAINSRVKSRPHKTECYKSYAEELPTHQRMKLRKVISTLARDPTRPSLFPSLTASQKAAVDDAQRCDSIRSMSDIVVCIDEAFVYRAAFKTLEPGGLLDDMVIDAYMRILDNQQREWGPPHQKITYYGSSHLHQFMRKCVMERKFSSGVPVHTNSAGFDIYESDRVFIPVYRSGVHWYLVEVDLLRRKVTILDSMRPRRTEKIALEIRTLGDIEAYRDKIVVSLLLSPLNRKEEDSSSRCFAWNGGSGAKVQWRKT
ncbi:hypothetical protein HHK36_033283 [Tetracentron sinense]|uniref:Ubiquitin-like protease family profile domain-containing protein n=1 Tax=Tetracentron sinense TaxID=13715 RepID=A0A835CWU0_TETSI|nr:hypothetical protein HHK36_033283 [Tetracentron sinense]